MPPVCARAIQAALAGVDAVLVGGAGKGVVSAALLDLLRTECRARGIWLSADPKPVNPVALSGLSLVTPNRKEAFELAGVEDSVHAENPLSDGPLMQAVERLLTTLRPAVLLVTLGRRGCWCARRGASPCTSPRWRARYSMCRARATR